MNFRIKVTIEWPFNLTFIFYWFFCEILHSRSTSCCRCCTIAKRNTCDIQKYFFCFLRICLKFFTFSIPCMPTIYFEIKRVAITLPSKDVYNFEETKAFDTRFQDNNPLKVWAHNRKKLTSIKYKCSGETRQHLLKKCEKNVWCHCSCGPRKVWESLILWVNVVSFVTYTVESLVNVITAARGKMTEEAVLRTHASKKADIDFFAKL